MERPSSPADAGDVRGIAEDPTVASRLEQETATANAIYGIIVSSAVMASVHGQTVLQLAVATLVTLVVYWTAERFAHVMAHRIVHSPRLGWPELRRELGRGWELVTASFLPLGALIGSRLLGASVSTAVLVALLSATALLSAAGWRVGRAADLTVLARLLSAVCAGGLGVVMIVLKTLSH